MSTTLHEHLCTALRHIQTWWPPDDEENLPWRINPSPYRIFLAEMLLVRTRADVVARLFEHVYSRYPDIFSLAEASQEELEEILRPLGLRKRVPYLIQAAQYIRDNYKGEIPFSVKQLKTIPGIGEYTAAAIAAFGYNLKIVPADVNIFRFFARFLGLPMEHPTKGSALLRRIVREVSEQCSEYSVAKLLDFTRKICRPRRPRCAECPLEKMCLYNKTSPPTAS